MAQWQVGPSGGRLARCLGRTNRRQRQPRPVPVELYGLAVLGVLMAIFLPSFRAARADVVRAANFLTLHKNAGTIVHGRCVAKRELVDGEPVPCTEYTFKVLTAVRGCRDEHDEVLRTITFRHVGTRTARQRADGTRVLPLRMGVPEYQVGEEAVLFLTRESSIGLCAPVGLVQGKFPVIKRRKEAWVSTRGNPFLFHKVPKKAFKSRGQEIYAGLRAGQKRIDLKSFLTLCQEVNR